MAPLNRYEQPPPNEFEVINNITAKCKGQNCNWQATASLEVEIHTGDILGLGGLIELCRKHHKSKKRKKGLNENHNQFLLFENGENVGFASVSSDASTGLYGSHN